MLKSEKQGPVGGKRDPRTLLHPPSVYGSSNKKDSPLIAFKKLLGDFKAGLSDFRRVSTLSRSALPATMEKHFKEVHTTQVEVPGKPGKNETVREQLQERTASLRTEHDVETAILTILGERLRDPQLNPQAHSSSNLLRELQTKLQSESVLRQLELSHSSHQTGAHTQTSVRELPSSVERVIARTERVGLDKQASGPVNTPASPSSRTGGQAGIRTVKELIGDRRGVPAATAQPSSAVSPGARSADRHSSTVGGISPRAAEQASVPVSGVRPESGLAEGAGSSVEIPISRAAVPTLSSFSSGAVPVTGADFEAAQAVREPVNSSSASMPAAARLARLMQAEALTRSGEGRPHPVLHALADAVRGGRGRDVADLDPAGVEHVLIEALGKQAVEQKLSTPVVKSMVERHNQALTLIQDRVKEMEQRAGLVGRQPSSQVRSFKASARVGPGLSSRPLPAASSVSVSSSRSSAVTVPSGTRVESHSRSVEREPDFRHMFHTNDFGHLPAAGEALVAEKERELKALNVPSNRGGPGVDRRLGLSDRAANRMMPTTIAAPSASPTVLIAPSSSGGGSTAAPGMGSRGAQPSQQKLTGKLTLMTADGRSIGSAELDGSLR